MSEPDSKVAYYSERPEGGFSGPHTAYVTIGPEDFAIGTEKHSDEPVTLRWSTKRTRWEERR